MQQIILNVSDEFAQGLAALEDKDGQTADERFAKYVRDIEQNEMGIAPDLSASRKAARLAELAEDGAAAKQARKDAKKLEREQRALDAPVATEGDAATLPVEVVG